MSSSTVRSARLRGGEQALGVGDRRASVGPDQPSYPIGSPVAREKIGW